MDNSKFNHLMLDIETLGNVSKSVIVSIAAVPFNMDGETGEPFYVDVNIQSCLNAGLIVNGSTIKWWLSKEEGARKKIYEAKNDLNLSHALHLLRLKFEKDWVNDIQVWGNGTRFDCGILEDAYVAINTKIPWNFRKERDVRTLVAFDEDVKKNTQFDGVPHDPVHDCLHQIKYVTEIYNKLKL